MPGDVTSWQHPFVDILKYCKHDKPVSGHVDISGDVKLILDKQIGKRVWRLNGAIAASNYLKMPIKKHKTSLNLIGKNIYFQLKISSKKLFSIHIEVEIDFASGSKEVFRFSLSNMYKGLGVSKLGSTVQVPLQLPAKWVFLAVNIKSLLVCIFAIIFSDLADPQAIESPTFDTISDIFHRIRLSYILLL